MDDDVLLYVIEQGIDWNEQFEFEIDGSSESFVGASVQLDIFSPGPNPVLSDDA